MTTTKLPEMSARKHQRATFMDRYKATRNWQGNRKFGRRYNGGEF